MILIVACPGHGLYNSMGNLHNKSRCGLNSLLITSHDYLSSAYFFSKLTFSKNSFRYTIKASKSLNPDQNRHYVGPDLGPNCLQRLSADNPHR